MEVTAEIEKMILTGTADEIDIEKVAVGDSMITMVQDGLLKLWTAPLQSPVFCAE